MPSTLPLSFDVKGDCRREYGFVYRCRDCSGQDQVPAAELNVESLFHLNLQRSKAAAIQAGCATRQYRSLTEEVSGHRVPMCHLHRMVESWATTIPT